MARVFRRGDRVVVLDDLVVIRMIMEAVTRIDGCDVRLPHQRPDALETPQAWCNAIALSPAAPGIGNGQDTADVVIEIEIAVFGSEAQSQPFPSETGLYDAYRVAAHVRRGLTGVEVIDTNDAPGSLAAGDEHRLRLHRCEQSAEITEPTRELVGLRLTARGTAVRVGGRLGVEDTQQGR
ncbi:MAG: hypothetical protein AAGF47_03770 [Planctomycetota bacterium]